VQLFTLTCDKLLQLFDVGETATADKPKVQDYIPVPLFETQNFHFPRKILKV